MKYKITVYKEVYEEYEVEANSLQEAEDNCLMGKEEPYEITVKESEVI